MLGFGVHSMGAKYNLCVLRLIRNRPEDQQPYSGQQIYCCVIIYAAYSSAASLSIISEQCEIVELLREDIFHVPVTLAWSDNRFSFAGFVAADIPQARGVLCFSHLAGTYSIEHLHDAWRCFFTAIIKRKEQHRNLLPTPSINLQVIKKFGLENMNGWSYAMPLS